MSSSDAMMSCMSGDCHTYLNALGDRLTVVLEMSQTHFQRVDLLVHVLHRTPHAKLRSWLSCPSCREACAPCAGRNRACCRGDRCRGSAHLRGLGAQRKTAAKALRLDPDVVRYVAGDFGDEGIVNLGVKSCQSNTLKMIMDSSVIILRIVFRFRRIAFSRQYAWSCPVRSRMNRQKVSAVECILCHQRRHRTHLLQDLTVRIDSTIMSTHKLRLIRLEER